MTTIGGYIKHARQVRKKTLEDLSDLTKIKKNFLKSIEQEEWKRLPEFPVVIGFVKSIANALDLNTENLVAILKRDYPPQKLEINPRPEPKQEFRWGPKLTFFLGVSLVLIGVIGYLIFQYAGFLRAPELEVIRPEANQMVFGRSLEVTGITEPDTSVVVNTQPAFVDEEGRFYTELDVNPDTTIIEIVAKSRSGKETKRSVNIQVQE